MTEPPVLDELVDQVSQKLGELREHGRSQQRGVSASGLAESAPRTTKTIADRVLATGALLTQSRNPRGDRTARRSDWQRLTRAVHHVHPLLSGSGYTTVSSDEHRMIRTTRATFAMTPASFASSRRRSAIRPHGKDNQVGDPAARVPDDGERAGFRRMRAGPRSPPRCRTGITVRRTRSAVSARCWACVSRACSSAGVSHARDESSWLTYRPRNKGVCTICGCFRTPSRSLTGRCPAIHQDRSGDPVGRVHFEWLVAP